MKHAKLRPIRMAAALGLIAVAFLGQGALAKDQFKITCEERGDDPSKNPIYDCFVKKNDGPKHAKLKELYGVLPGESAQWTVDTAKIVILEEGFGTLDDGKPGIRSCPGWFFIGGKWVYVTRCALTDTQIGQDQKGMK